MPTSKPDPNSQLNTQHSKLESRSFRFLLACCKAEPTDEDLAFIDDFLRRSTPETRDLTAFAYRHGVLPLVYKRLKAVVASRKSQVASSWEGWRAEGGERRAESGERTESEKRKAESQGASAESGKPGANDKRRSANDEARTTNDERRTINDYPLEQLLADLKSAYSQIVHRNMLLSAELLHLAAFARENGLAFLPFKGPVLAQAAYGDLTLRQFGDLDVLIACDEFDSWSLFLRGRGYAPHFPVERYRGKRRVLCELNNDVPYLAPSRGLMVELHWEFFRKLAIPTAPFRPWQDPESVRINGREIPTLSHETHLLYVALHGAKHIYERLIWLVDLDRMVRSRPDTDWELLLERARELGAQRLLLLGLSLAHDWLDTPLPGRITALFPGARLEEARSFIAGEFARPVPTPEESLVKFRLLLSLRDDTRTRLRMLGEFLFRPGINERRTIVLPDRLFGLYWLIRPFGMAGRFLFCRLLKACGKERDQE